MKKLVCLAIALVMVLGLAACASAEFKFERKIDLVCRGVSAAALTPPCARWPRCSRISWACRLRL